MPQQENRKAIAPWRRRVAIAMLLLLEGMGMLFLIIAFAFPQGIGDLTRDQALATAFMLAIATPMAVVAGMLYLRLLARILNRRNA